MSSQKRQTTVQFEPGAVIGQTYKVLAHLGSGGMGTVYAVEHLLMHKQLALKLLTTPDISPTSWQRFRQEATALARFPHANIVQITDMGIEGERFPYYVMELLSGQSLRDKLKARGRLKTIETIDIFIQLAEALAFVHDGGIIHRDIKPDNIMLETSGSQNQILVKLVDFGISKIVTDDGYSLTSTGEIFGSPIYMSPEQCRGEKLDQRSDIYSLGCAIFECLTGTPPLVGRNATATMSLKQTETAPRLSQSISLITFPRPLEDLVASMLAREPESRPRSLHMVSRQLRDIRDGLALTQQNVGTDMGEREQGLPGNVVPIEDETTRTRLKNRNKSLQKTLLVSALAAAVLVSLAVWIIFSMGAPKPAAKTRLNDAPLPSSAAGIDSGVTTNSGYSTDNSDTSSGISSDTGSASESTDTERSLSALAAGNAPFLSDGAPPDNHPDLNELAKIKVLSEMKELPDGSRKYVFHFPKDFSIGRLGVWGPRCPDGKLEAKGEQEYPPWAKVLFQPYDFFTADPQNFDKFGAETLDELDFTRRQNVNTKTLETASRITSIKTLKLSQTGIDASSLAMLDKFKKLQKLEILSDRITDNDLALCPALPMLKKLTVHRATKLSKTLDVLSKSYELQELDITDCKLFAGDLEKIAKMKFLRVLVLKGTGITDKDLSLFADLPELTRLDLTECKVKAQSMSIIKKYKQLRFLRVDEMDWTQDEYKKVKYEILPTKLQTSGISVKEIHF